MNEKIIEEQLEYIKNIKFLNEKKNLYYNILTMGCQLNENDSEKISGMATEMGYIYTDNLEQANLYIINTCCVRENAEEKLFGKVKQRIPQRFSFFHHMFQVQVSCCISPFKRNIKFIH